MANDDVNEEFGRRLRQAREALGISQQELAIRAGVDRLSVHHWEHLKHRPSLEMAAKAAKALGCSLDWLAWGKKR